MQDRDVAFMTDGVLANICATGYAEAIITAQPYRYAILDRMPFAPPLLWDISSEAEVKHDCQEIIATLLENGLLCTCPFEKEQHISSYMLMSKYARGVLADTLTLASVHHAVVALDDPVIRKRVVHLLLENSIHSTLTILHRWSITCRVPDRTIQSAIERIVHLAHFIPPNDDPLLPWWSQFLCA